MLTGFFGILILHSIAMVYAQDDQSGFISIDCGITRGSSYTDTTTGINYVSDAEFIDGGESRNISIYTNRAPDDQYITLTSFPHNTRNCYTLRPQQGKGHKYLIRAKFMYGNYDLLDQAPQFDLYLGPNLWTTVISDASQAWFKEIIHITSSDYIYVCLVNRGLGNPFISALELRLLDSTMYNLQLGSLNTYQRYHFGTNEKIRYEDDKYDRLWIPMTGRNTRPVQTSNTVSSGASTEKVPTKVMSTAITSIGDALFNTWEADSTTDEFVIYIHLAEVEILKSNKNREFNIYLNGDHWYGPFSPLINTTTISINPYPENGSLNYTLKINKTQNSILPPILNAIELYTLKKLQQQQTEDQDADAIWSTKSMYGLKRNWQGDPCVPQAFVWDGLNCSYDDPETPRIISLNLSSSGLSGEISSAFANLTMIQSLDLSYNGLTGTVPEFLAQLDYLKILNIRGNNFTRPLPAKLLAKSNNGSLFLSIEASRDEDSSSCSKGSCENNKHNKVVIPVIATAAAFLVLLTTLAILWIIKRHKTQDPIITEELFEPKYQRFTFSEVQSITDNFNTVIGRGGYGTVYHGYIAANQVAVKMLSKSSTQGYKEFLAEVNLLMGAHHRNITSLAGYCNEGSHKGIIYEYMANGNLERHLFDGSPKVLSWESRLQIACDAAEGLAYMHHGCRRPIVHRDVKCSNILLNERFQAKLSDFGLSRAFTTESITHVSTVVAGTRGYIDPEYNVTNKLTKKSDVYSFGVVLLELMTSQRAISKDINIINWVKSKVAEGSVENIIDPRLHGVFNINTAWKVAELAMACVAHISEERPTMNYVVTELQDCLQTVKASHWTRPNTLNEGISLGSDMSVPHPR